MRMIIIVVLVVLAAMAAEGVALRGTRAGPPAPIDITGRWNTTYSGSLSGTCTVAYIQSGTNLTLTRECPGSGTGTGTIDPATGSFTTTAWISGLPMSNEGTVSGDGNSISGTWEAPDVGLAGTFSGTRKKDLSADTDGDTTPNSSDLDDDSDGCTDEQELGSNANLGGWRDPHNFWDYADMPDPNDTPQRDRMIRIGDIVRVLNRYGTDGDPNIDPLSTPPKTGYHAAYDRTYVGPNPWELGPPDGMIRIGDVVGVLNQYGHDCAEPA